MYSVTHIALGACVGGMLAGKSIGRKSLLWGGLAQSFPDIDFLAGLWCDPGATVISTVTGFTSIPC